MSLFSERWESEVKPLAEACVTEPEYVRLMIDYEEKELTEEERAYLHKIQENYKHPQGMFQIANMIWKVDTALADGKYLNALIAVHYIHKMLNAHDYLEEFFQGNSSNEEYKTRMALRDAIRVLL